MDQSDATATVRYRSSNISIGQKIQNFELKKTHKLYCALYKVTMNKMEGNFQRNSNI